MKALSKIRQWYDHLTPRAILVLLAMAAVSVLLLYFCYVNTIGSYVDKRFESVLDEANSSAEQLKELAEASDCDLETVESYVTANDVFCTVSRDGLVVYENLPASGDGLIAAISTVSVKAPDGRPLAITVFSQPADRDELSSSVESAALKSTIILNIVIFALTAFLIFFIFLTPIVRLRGVVRDYATYGTIPQKSSRRDEIGRLQNSFVELTQTLSSKEANEHRIISSIAHDIRTPLTSVLGFSERLLTAKLTEEKKEQYLQSIHDRSLAIKSVVDDFDEYLEAGQTEGFSLTPTTVRELCDRLTAEYRDELAEAGVTFNIVCSCPGERILGNYDRLRRYFGNLVGNAIQHSGASPLVLTVKCFRQDSQIICDFSDNGSGVPDEIMGKIFDPFFTSDKGRKVSGLGLSICRSIIRSHGGSIRAENLPTGGLLVRAYIPCLERN